MRSQETWAVILAGGEGTRLSNMTTSPEGWVIPKQYCSLGGEPCLLQDALSRARAVALPSNICTVVASQHRRWWTSAVQDLEESNVFVQPQNRGTAIGILLALVNLEMRNPAATVVLLPADHYFRDEHTVATVLRVAENLARANSDATYLLGAEPGSADPELGYILPSEKVFDNPARIAGFKEKPSLEHARELVALGALWNLFILAGSVSALLQLFAEDHAELVHAMRGALTDAAAGRRDAVDELYTRIEPLDFSGDVLEIQANRLHALRVPPCGWTDLGTPKRVEATIRSIEVGVDRTGRRSGRSVPLFFDLAAR
jgi:mannose-1-phosphate guanylyltransferase